MRKLATFQDPVVARTVCEVLYAENIDSDLREDGERTLSVWVLAETDVPRAQSILDRFAAVPNAREFARARERAQRPQQPAAEPGRDGTDVAPPPPVPQSKKSFGQRAKESPVTFSLIAISVAVMLATWLGKDEAMTSALSIAKYYVEGRALHWHGWSDVLSGQVWRVITPIFLHANFIHIAFNMVITYQLGSPTERFQGSVRFIGFVLWSAAVSNIAQFVFAHAPNFMGMSGVVYALVGYLWARGYADPASGIYLPGRFVVSFMLLMAVGFTGALDGAIGRSANYCHLGGFVAGIVYGYIAALLARRQRTR